MEKEPKNKMYLNNQGLMFPSAHTARKKLSSGVYSLGFNDQLGIYFDQMSINNDAIVDLPETAYSVVLDEMNTFLTPSTQEKFEQHGFLYKRSALIYGPAGTGKTMIVNRVAKEVIDRNGIVIFNPNPELLPHAYQALDDLQPETFVLVIFEEMDRLIERYEKELLLILDGQIQKQGIMYLATTNYIDKIPQRVMRPGRFSSTIEVGYPTRAARVSYLKTKLKQESLISEIVDKTDNFTIDELKEVVLASQCLGYTVDQVVQKLKVLKQNGVVIESVNEDDDEDNSFLNQLKRAIPNQGGWAEKRNTSKRFY